MNQKKQYLDFELPVEELDKEIAEIEQKLITDDNQKLKDQLEKFKNERKDIITNIFKDLTDYQKVRLSRHVNRPLFLDYVDRVFEEFIELHGDRVFGDDGAIVGGLAKLDIGGELRSVITIGHQRGATMDERVKRNFGMSQPEGNRKAQRLIALANKFAIPIILFIDTQGAYPGLEAETRGQAESIASSIYDLCEVNVPIISVVIGEGGSGGALALGVCDRLLMLENSIYSVITPEGCASILWGKGEDGLDPKYIEKAAECLRITAKDLEEFDFVDEVVKEPLGGAHNDYDEAASNVSQSLIKHLSELLEESFDTLATKRYEKLKSLGKTATV